MYDSARQLRTPWLVPGSMLPPPISMPLASASTGTVVRYSTAPAVSRSSATTAVVPAVSCTATCAVGA